ncbi:MAG TPA: dihydroorotase, partial [Kofleriaceae bacterium]|nr:dihydroorotase [Kofleriaceae bacterium]
LIVSRARAVGHVRVLPIGAISRGQKGEALAEFGDMKEAGIVAVSDDGRPVMNAGLMRRALEYARTFSLPVIQHAEDLDLIAGGIADEGPVSTRCGLAPRPAAAESTMVARDLELLALTGGRYHVAHVSAQRSVDLIRDARRRGLPVTCEAAPHHFSLTVEALAGYDSNAVVAPPLRSGADVDAIIAGLADGTIDCIATDHAPHSAVEKDVELACAAPGMIGFQTALPLALALWRRDAMSLARVIELLTVGPARAFGLAAGTLTVGAAADVCVIDPDLTWVVDKQTLRSKSHNTPYLGREVKGACVLTVVGGHVAHDPEARCG